MDTVSGGSLWEDGKAVEFKAVGCSLNFPICNLSGRCCKGQVEKVMDTECRAQGVACICGSACASCRDGESGWAENQKS